MSEAAELLSALGIHMAAAQWDLSGTEIVPVTRWGKDHWTTFAYVEDCIVNHRGMLDHDKMRCDRVRHPMFHASKRRVLSDADGSRYATRLKTPACGDDGVWGVEELYGHDDYDCVNDAIHAGLLTAVMPRERAPHGDIFVDAFDRPVQTPDHDLLKPGFITGLDELWLMTAASFQLTKPGQEVIAELRIHLSARKKSHQFMPAYLTGPASCR